MKQVINAEDILQFAVKENWNVGYDLAVTEFCPYNEARRIDLFYFKRWNRETKGYEIKVTRSDFLNDRKWQEYLKFCTWFSFIAPKGVIKKEELPENIGLVEIEVREIPDEERRWSRFDVEKGEAHYQLYKHITKRPRRLHDQIADDDYTRLLEGLLFKMIYNRNVLKTEH